MASCSAPGILAQALTKTDNPNTTTRKNPTNDDASPPLNSEGLTHANVDLAQASAGLAVDSEGLTHANVDLAQASAGLPIDSEGLTHANVDLAFDSEGLAHASAGLPIDSEGLTHASAGLTIDSDEPTTRKSPAHDDACTTRSTTRMI
ncbi:MAG: hypothetical protein K0U66_10820 [Gammaproteobacteria bacterium]|nr:hypothetical protein [Gammaproteobacteria bacterium]